MCSSDLTGHESVLWFAPLAPRDSDDFFSDARYGEFWVGARPTLAEIETELGLTARDIADLGDALVKDAGTITVRMVRDAEQSLTARLDGERVANGAAEENLQEADGALAHEVSTMRLTKDEYEIDQMRQAVAATAVGFEAMIADLPQAVSRGRGERWLEGVFGLHARHQGNGVGYESICAAGVEVDSLYTADITRTLPVNGSFTEAQREIYAAVYAAQEAGIAAVRPGAKFSDIHSAAIAVFSHRP